MKYAITDRQGGIMRVADTAPLTPAPQAVIVEITDEQAATVAAGNTADPRVRYWLMDGELLTHDEWQAARAADRLIPSEIANWRARAVLELAGLLPTVDALITAMTGPEGIVVRSAWTSGAPLVRKGPTVISMSAALGLTKEQVNALFVQAAALEV